MLSRLRMYFLFGLTFIGLALFFSRDQAVAQNVTGQISGRLDDPSGSVVTGASVELTNDLTHQTRKTESKSNGEFVFVELLPGVYSVKVEHPGFRTFQQSRIEVTATERVTLGPLHLQVGDVSSSVTVESESARVQTESSERVGLISTSQVENTPLRGRDYVGLLKLLPGVTDTVTRDAPEAAMSDSQRRPGRSGADHH